MTEYINEFYGKKVTSRQGTIGHIKDFYFDEIHWNVRYVTIDIGWLLSSNAILIPIQQIGTLKVNDEPVSLNMSSREINECASLSDYSPTKNHYSKSNQMPFYGIDSLRSTKSLEGGTIQTEDTRQAIIAGFMVDCERWEISDCVTRPDHWLSESQTLISPLEIRTIIPKHFSRTL